MSSDPHIIKTAEKVAGKTAQAIRGLPKFFREFIATESASGVVMISFAALALLMANSGLSDVYKSVVNAPLTFGFDYDTITEPLKTWVKDILMVFFFLVIGMELKREMHHGVLARRDQVLLPLVAAVGGMLAPALIFYGFNRNSPEMLVGWAIPSATDIAFALSILVLVGKNVPSAAKIFLLAVAIFDDLGAIIIIAAFYNTELAFTPLLLALPGLGLLLVLNRMRVSTLAPYFMAGTYLWFCFYHGGIHTTLAGVIVGFSIPMRRADSTHHSPLDACMHFMHPWVSYFILPLFAFTSAGVSLKHLDFSHLLAPLPLGIALGLFFGKQIGIFGTSWVMIKLKLANLPQGTTWVDIYALSIMAGIGFTMSLFIGILAFPDEAMQEMVKVGVLGGTLLAVVWGTVVMRAKSFILKGKIAHLR